MLEEQFDELMKFYAEYGRATAGEYNYSGIKERYEKVFGERSVPGKYRDPNEEEDNQCHCSSCEGEGDYIATATDRDIADWRIEELKERGLYEEQQ